MLSTVMAPTHGSIQWNGRDACRDPAHLRQTLGYLPQHLGVYPQATAREFLHYMAALKGLHGRTRRSRVDTLIERVGLLDSAHRKMGGYSSDLRRRVGLAQALLNDPQLLLVDDPGAGLDLEERSVFCALIGARAARRLVIVATRDVKDVGPIASAIILLKGGCVLRAADGREMCAPSDLLATVSGMVWSVVVSADRMVEMRREHFISSVDRQSGRVRLHDIASEQPVADAVPVSPTLEDAYAYCIHRDPLEIS
jgi:ABC-2 type transport system ATP-binding protein